MSKLTAIAAALIAAALTSGFILLQSYGRGSGPRQPIDFDHWQHISKEEGPQLDCSTCHEHANQSPNATIPSISVCMVCHESINTDSPEIKKLTAFAERKEEPAWERVYWIDSEADVFFNHKSHIRAEVACSNCHGQVSEAHRIKREVEHSMGWCIACHQQKSASVDCYMCHR